MSSRFIFSALLFTALGFGSVSDVEAGPWYWPLKPDLKITSMNVFPWGNYDVLIVTVKNGGPGNAGPFQVRFAGQVPGKIEVVNGLGWGQSKTLMWITPTVGPYGYYSRSIWVDYVDSVDEWNENNNKYAIVRYMTPLLY